MSQKAEKPPDPAHEAKLAARREKHGARVWAANPRTQELQRKYDAALQQLQILRDGTFCRQYQQMQQWCKQVEGEREAMEQQLMRVEGERTKMHIFAVVKKAAGKTAEEAASKAEDKMWQEHSDGTRHYPLPGPFCMAHAVGEAVRLVPLSASRLSFRPLCAWR